MAIDWGVVMNALGRGLEGGVQGYQMGKQWERQKQQDEEGKQFREWQQRETTMGRLDRASDRAQTNIQRQAAIEANQRAQQAAAEKEARELQAARETVRVLLGDDPIAGRLPANFDPKMLDPVIRQLSNRPDPYGGRTRDQWIEDLAAQERIRSQFREPPAPRAWAPHNMQEAVEVDRLKKANAGPRLTEGERRASALLGLVEQASAEVDRLGGADFAANVATRIPMVGNYIARKVDDDSLQRDQAGRQFVTNLLYLLSGQAAPEGEIESNRRIYIPAPGDDKATLARKAEARQQALRSARQIAGNAAQLPAPTMDRAPVTDIMSRYGLTPKPGGQP